MVRRCPAIAAPVPAGARPWRRGCSLDRSLEEGPLDHSKCLAMLAVGRLDLQALAALQLLLLQGGGGKSGPVRGERQGGKTRAAGQRPASWLGGKLHT